MLSLNDVLRTPVVEPMPNIQIYRNKLNMQDIFDYLTDEMSPEIKGVLLRGPIGCGKMTLLNKCLEQLRLPVRYFDEEDDYEIIQRLTCVCVIKNIDDAIKSTARSRFYKFISSCDKKSKLLITSHDTTIGTIREIPKCILQLHFEPLCIVDFVKIGHEIQPDVKKSVLEKMAKASNGDLRFFMNKLNYSMGDSIDVNQMRDEKLYQLDTFECMRFCGRSAEKSIEDRVQFSSSYTNAAVFHNYPRLYKSKNSELIDLICLAEELRSFTYANQEWENFETYYCVLGTILPMEFIGPIENNDLTYPPSIVNSVKELTFDQLQEESIKNNTKMAKALRLGKIHSRDVTKKKVEE